LEHKEENEDLEEDEEVLGTGSNRLFVLIFLFKLGNDNIIGFDFNRGIRHHFFLGFFISEELIQQLIHKRLRRELQLLEFLFFNSKEQIDWFLSVINEFIKQ
jgi:hypothetical protein